MRPDPRDRLVREAVEGLAPTPTRPDEHLTRIALDRIRLGLESRISGLAALAGPVEASVVRDADGLAVRLSAWVLGRDRVESRREAGRARLGVEHHSRAAEARVAGHVPDGPWQWCKKSLGDLLGRADAVLSRDRRRARAAGWPEIRAWLRGRLAWRARPLVTVLYVPITVVRHEKVVEVVRRGTFVCPHLGIAVDPREFLPHLAFLQRGVDLGSDFEDARAEGVHPGLPPSMFAEALRGLAAKVREHDRRPWNTSGGPRSLEALARHLEELADAAG